MRSFPTTTTSVVVFSIFSWHCEAFRVFLKPPHNQLGTDSRLSWEEGSALGRTRRYATVPEKNPDVSIDAAAAAVDDDDAKLLKSVKKEFLVDLCRQMNIDTKGAKEELLIRLRAHATAQTQAAQQQRLERVRKIEEGSADDNPKERYEVVGSENGQHDVLDEDEDEDFVYYHAPHAFPSENAKTLSNQTEETLSKPKKASYITQADVTAPPPPPDVKPNEKGERVVQVYSTTDQNDLTGIAAAQPGLNAMSTDALTSASASGTTTGITTLSSSSSAQPWDPAITSNQRATNSREEAQAQEQIVELVQTLLSQTGLPAFCWEEDDDDEAALKLSTTGPIPTSSFTGFNPATVPTDLLQTCSKALRTGRGIVLQDVLRQFEMQAIGQDGMHGDNVENGGGHYREVAKVRAFLEGFRRAELRRIARETTTLLLDKLVTEGVQGLDITLATMTRSNDDTSDQGGELNDSLVDYLNDAIRQQEKKVDKLVAGRLETSKVQSASSVDETNSGSGSSSSLDHLWNVTTEDGQRLESIDPNEPAVKMALEEELVKEEITQVIEQEKRITTPESAPEKLLVLLTALRDRIKAEAAFVPDEKGRNLRLLAYCLQLKSDGERTQLIAKELGNSIDRIDSFLELVASSVEYGESTSYQLQPAKTKRPLNVRELRRILSLAKVFRQEQERKATGFQ